MDDADLALSEKSLYEIKWPPEVSCCKVITHLFMKNLEISQQNYKNRLRIRLNELMYMKVLYKL